MPSNRDFFVSGTGKVAILLRIVLLSGLGVGALMLPGLIGGSGTVALVLAALPFYGAFIWAERLWRALRGPLYRFEDGELVVPGGFGTERTSLDDLREVRFVGGYGAARLRFRHRDPAVEPTYETDTEELGVHESLVSQKVLMNVLEPEDRRHLGEALAAWTDEQPDTYSASSLTKLLFAGATSILGTLAYEYPFEWLTARIDDAAKSLAEAIPYTSQAVWETVGFGLVAGLLVLLILEAIRWLGRLLRTVTGPLYGVENGELVVPGLIWEQRFSLDTLADVTFHGEDRADLVFAGSRAVHPTDTTDDPGSTFSPNPLRAYFGLPPSDDRNPTLRVRFSWLENADAERLRQRIRQERALDGTPDDADDDLREL